MSEGVLLYYVAFPVLVGLVCCLLPRRLGTEAAMVSLAGAAATFLLCCQMPWLKGAAFRLTWFSARGWVVGVGMRVDALAGFTTVFIGLFGFLVICYSLPYMRRHSFQGRYHALVQWSVAASLGATLAENLVFFLAAWGMLTLMFCLLVRMGEGSAGPGIRAVNLLPLIAGDAALVAGVALLCSLTGTTEVGAMAALGPRAAASLLPATAGLGAVAFLLMLVGAVAKAGAMPLHAWVTAASETAPLPVMALVPAMLARLLGAGLLARVALQFFQATPVMGTTVMAVGVAAALVGAVMAALQHDLRRLLAYLVASEAGWVMVGLGTGAFVGATGALLYVLNSAMALGLLFLAAGVVRRRTGETHLGRLGGLARPIPVTFAAAAVAALAVAGVPPFSGFTSKRMIYQGVLDACAGTGYLLLCPAVLASAVAVMALARALRCVFLGRPVGSALAAAPRRAPLVMVLPVLMLAVLCVLMGVSVELPVSEWLGPSVAELAAGRVGIGGTGVRWASPATGLLVGGLALGIVLCVVGWSRWMRAPVPGRPPDSQAATAPGGRGAARREH